jgi:hypothetical protein
MQQRNRWMVPAALILLTLIPLAAGGVRLGELVGGRRDHTQE